MSTGSTGNDEALDGSMRLKGRMLVETHGVKHLHDRRCTLAEFEASCLQTRHQVWNGAKCTHERDLDAEASDPCPPRGPGPHVEKLTCMLCGEPHRTIVRSWWADEDLSTTADDLRLFCEENGLDAAAIRHAISRGEAASGKAWVHDNFLGPPCGSTMLGWGDVERQPSTYHDHHDHRDADIRYGTYDLWSSSERIGPISFVDLQKLAKKL